MNSMNAIDTNTWLYNHDPRDPGKQAVAQQVVATTRPLALPWQVGCEFIAGCRKLSSVRFTEDQAWDALDDMRSLSDVILLPVPDSWQEARVAQKAHMLSFWDALLVAVCIRNGVSVLYTEDMGSPRTIETLTLVNPFLLPAGP
jgi:predicted nucleic acid-binding protein